MAYNYDNYIYLRYANYIKYENGGASRQYFNAQRDELLSRIKGQTYDKDKGTAQRLQNLLNSFYSGKNGGAFTCGMTAEKHQQIIDSVNNILNQKFGGIWSFDPNTGKVQKPTQQDVETSKQKMIKIIEGVNNRQSVLEAKIEALETMMATIGPSNPKILQKMEQVKELWELVCKEANDIVNSGQKVYYNTAIPKNISDGKVPASYAEFVKEFNRVVTAVTGSLTSRVAGAVGEYLVATILATLTDSIDNIEEAVVGDLTNFAFFNSQGVSGALVNNQNTEDIFKEVFSNFKPTTISHNGKNMNVMVRSRATQQKADLSFTFEGEPITASVKNINMARLKSGTDDFIISAVSGTNPFILLDNNEQLFCHYLNITSMHQTRANKKIDGKKPDPPLNPAPGLLHQAHKTIKTLMMIRGIFGSDYRLDMSQSTLQSGSAKYFILNDSSTGRFYVRTMGSLLQKIVNSGQQYFDIAEKTKKKYKDGTEVILDGYPASLDYKYDIGDYLKWDKGGQQRIKHIYKQIAKQNISIKLSGRLFV